MFTTIVTQTLIFFCPAEAAFLDGGQGRASSRLLARLQSMGRPKLMIAQRLKQSGFCWFENGADMLNDIANLEYFGTVRFGKVDARHAATEKSTAYHFKSRQASALPRMPGESA
jgi:hypothetical protein